MRSSMRRLHRGCNQITVFAKSPSSTILAGFVSPWQCFGGVCRFLSGMGFQTVALALVFNGHRELGF